MYSRAQDLTRVILQRNRIHHPHSDSNTWKENRPRPGKRESYHPEGPQAVYFDNSRGNHVIRKQANDPLGDYDYDLFTGESRILDEREMHGVRGEPIYIEGCGMREGKGRFQLSPKSPGYDAALRLPNFNDDYTGKGPDIGAHEADTPVMAFGADAHSKE